MKEEEELIGYFSNMHFGMDMLVMKAVKKYDNKTMDVSLNVKAYTFTILSAYFINHETSKPVDPRFSTTIQVVIL